jgi:DNA-binding Lrp family transcriptional regulator
MPLEITVALSYTRAHQLPEAVNRDLLQLVTHSDEILKFLEETKAQKPSALPRRFSRQLSQRLSISLTEAGRLLNALQNLQLINQETGDHEKTFAIIADRLTMDVREKWIGAKAVILSIFTEVDDDHPAIISQKARRLSFQYERIFVNADILTDLRPVFTIRGDKVLEMIIQHKLVITQHDSTHTDSDVHLVLDARDLINLKTACERAIQKAKVLQDTLASLPLITETVSDDEQT